MDLDLVFARREAAVGLDDLVDLPPAAPPVEDPVDRYWNWMTGRASSPEFLGTAGGLELLVVHPETFWQRRLEPNVVMVHYADLEADLAGEMRRLAKRLGVTWEPLCGPARPSCRVTSTSTVERRRRRQRRPSRCRA